MIDRIALKTFIEFCFVFISYFSSSLPFSHFYVNAHRHINTNTHRAIEKFGHLSRNRICNYKYLRHTVLQSIESRVIHFCCSVQATSHHYINDNYIKRVNKNHLATMFPIVNSENCTFITKSGFLCVSICFKSVDTLSAFVVCTKTVSDSFRMFFIHFNGLNFYMPVFSH